MTTNKNIWASSKRCPNCNATKPLDEFHRNRTREDGHDDYCKLCTRERNRRYRENNSEKERERKRQWRKNNSEERREDNRRWRAINPEKARAHDLVGHAKEAGKLPPASAHFCFVCGTSSDQDAHMEYHHLDYSKPLEVISVCKPCHARWHVANGETT